MSNAGELVVIDGATGKVIPEGTPTQVAHPWRAILRTILAAVVGSLLAWVVRTFGLDLAPFSDGIVDSLTGVVWAAATALVQWLLVHPALQGFWRAVRLDPGTSREVLVSRAALEEDDTPPPPGWTPGHRA